MWNFVDAFLNKVSTIDAWKPEILNFLYGEEYLNEKPTAGKLKKKAHGASSESEPLLLQTEDGCCASEKTKGGISVKRDDSGNSASEKTKGGIRVKVLMTKKEAIRLLSKCKDGGRLEFKDVAHELVQIPINRVTVVSWSSS